MTVAHPALDPPPAARRRRGRAARAALVAAAVLAIAVLLTAYLLRGPIGAWLLVGWLKARGVPASVSIDQLDTGGVSGRLALGPASDPDLMVERVEVVFEPGFLWRDGLAAPRIHSVRLLRPRLKAAFDGHTLRLGTLQRLVDELVAAPPAGPSPDIEARQGEVRLATSAGMVVAAGDADLSAGRLIRLDATLGPTHLASGGLGAELTSGTLSLRGSAGGLAGRFRLTGATLGFGAAQARDVIAFGTLAAPYPKGGPAPFDGPVALELTAQAASARSGGGAYQAPQATLGFKGTLRGVGPRLSAQGAARLAVAARAADLGGARIEEIDAEAVLPDAALAIDSGRWRLEGPLTAKAHADRAVFSGAAPVLRDASWSPAGTIQAGSDGLAADLRGPLSGRESVDRGAVDRMAQGVPVIGADAAGRAAAGRALAAASLSSSDLRLTLSDGGRRGTVSGALRLASAGGGSASLSPDAQAPLLTWDARGGRGAFKAEVAGGGLPAVTLNVTRYRLDVSGSAWSLDAQTAFDLGLSTAQLHKARLSGRGRLIGAPGRFAFTAEGCLDAGAAAVMSGADTLASAVEGQFCPAAGAPMVKTGPGGWSLAARAVDVAAASPALQAAVAKAEAVIALSGGRTGQPAGRLELTSAEVADRAPSSRFAPVRVSGAASSEGGPWQGRFDLAEAAHGRPLGSVSARADPAGGTGEAQITADLAFAAGGLQPGDLSPAARKLAPRASGRVGFTGAVRWTRGGQTSDGRLTVQDLGFRSAAGQVSGVRADVRFASLMPLATAGVQTASATRVDWLTPLTDLQTSFSVDPEALRLQSARASAAGGTLELDPLTAPFAPGSSLVGRVRFTGVDLAVLIEALGLSDRMSAQARLDGELNFTVAPKGFEVGGGRMVSEGPGRLSIYRAALTDASAAPAAPGASAKAPIPSQAMNNLAYEALEDLAFDRLDATIEPRASRRLGVVFHINGRHDPAIDPKPSISIIDILRGKAFDKPIPLPKGTPINLTLDTSLNLGDLLDQYFGATSGAGSAKVQP